MDFLFETPGAAFAEETMTGIDWPEAPIAPAGQSAIDLDMEDELDNLATDDMHLTESGAYYDGAGIEPHANDQMAFGGEEASAAFDVSSSATDGVRTGLVCRNDGPFQFRLLFTSSHIPSRPAP